MRGILLVISLAALASHAAAQGVLWVVDDDLAPGADFATIQEAVDAAADGDGVLVRAGSYDAFQVVGKGLTVVGEPGAQVDVVGDLGGATALVSDTGGGQTVLLQNLFLTRLASPVETGPGLSVLDCAGPVWVEDCQVFGGRLSSAVVIEDSASVVLTRCSAKGKPANTPNNPSTRGLSVLDANVRAYDSDFEGMDSIVNSFLQTCNTTMPAGAGARIAGASASLFASGCTFRGADGAAGYDAVDFLGGAEGGDGGDGLIVDTSGPVELLNCQVIAGQGGAPSTTCPGGSAGTALPTGLPTSDVAEPGWTFTDQTPVFAGTVTTIELSSARGATGVLLFSGQPTDVQLASIFGPLLVGPIARTVPTGPGDLNLPVNLPPGVDFRVHFLQFAYTTNGGARRLASASALVVLAP